MARSSSGRDRDRGSRRRSRGGFEYRPTSKERLDQRSRGFRSGFIREDIPRFKVTKDKHRLRIMPPGWVNEDGTTDFAYDVWVHWNIGPNSAAFLDLNKMLKEPDPISEEEQALREEGDSEAADKLQSKLNVGYYVIDRDEEKKGPQFWLAPPWQVAAKIAAKAVDEDTGESLNIDDPEEGYDIIVTRHKKSSKDQSFVEYDVDIARRSSPLGGRNADDWLDFIQDNPIPDILEFKDYDEIADVFNARPKKTRRDEEEEEEEQSSRGKREKPSATYEEVMEMEIDDLEDLIDEERLDLDPDDFDEDSELAEAVCEELGLKPTRRSRRDKDDEVRPSRGRGRRSRRDEEEEEEEEDEPRSRRGRRSRRDEEEEDEKLDRLSSRRRRSRGRDEEEEEEEEDRPRRSSRRSGRGRR